MKTRSSLRISFVLSAFALTSFLSPSIFATPQVTRPTTTPATKTQQGGYIKALPGIDGAIGAAQTAIHRFVPVHGNGPSISLVAAIHIGEKSYYQQLQHFLDKQDVVLYEGVRLSRKAVKTKAVQADRVHSSKGAKAPTGLYKKMSDALGLQFQLEGIRYDRPQFRNSDLDWEAMNALATKAGPDTRKLLTELRNTVSGGSSLTEDDLMLDQVLKLSASTPLVSTLLRRLLVAVLCEPGKLRALLGLKLENSGPPDAAKKLDAIVVNERNKAVLADLKALLKAAKQSTAKPVRSIAVFYGAAHMKDIEGHLISNLGYRPAQVQWITAIQAR